MINDRMFEKQTSEKVETMETVDSQNEWLGNDCCLAYMESNFTPTQQIVDPEVSKEEISEAQITFQKFAHHNIL